jgi:prepilin-type N-terminal cleavage/methylation domain-containing protein
MKISQAKKLLINKSRSNTAFSLIELSIVILVIGIIVTAVTSSSSLLGRASLTAARKYTGDSSVRYSQGVIAWYDATSENAFGANTSILADKSQLTTFSASPNVLFDDGTPILIRSPILYTAPSVPTYEVYSPRFAVAKSAYLISCPNTALDVIKQRNARINVTFIVYILMIRTKEHIVFAK